MAAKTDTSLNMFILREPASTTTTATRGKLNINKRIAFKTIYRNITSRMHFAMATLTKCYQLKIFVFPRIKPIDIMQVVDLKSHTVAFMYTTFPTCIMIPSKNPQTFRSPFSSFKEKGVRLLRPGKE